MSSLIGLLLLVVVAGIPLWLFVGLTTLVSAAIVPLGATAITLLYGDAVAADAEEREADDVERRDEVASGVD